MAAPRETVYSDTEAGALVAFSQLTGLTGRCATPDPSVEGVWLVDAPPNGRAIVYLAGYRDPFGRVREANDFEMED